MTPLLFLAVSLAGGLGSALRFVVDGAVTARTRSRFPVGTNVINVTGSFALGVVTGLAAGAPGSEPWHLIVGTGFLGGYTTFSTASLETVRLLGEGRVKAGLLNGFGMLAGAVLAAAIGYGIAFGILSMGF